MPIQECRPDVPAALVQIIDKLHCKNPAERYATADEVARGPAVLTAADAETLSLHADLTVLSGDDAYHLDRAQRRLLEVLTDFEQDEPGSC